MLKRIQDELRAKPSSNNMAPFPPLPAETVELHHQLLQPQPVAAIQPNQAQAPLQPNINQQQQPLPQHQPEQLEHAIPDARLLLHQVGHGVTDARAAEMIFTCWSLLGCRRNWTKAMLHTLSTNCGVKSSTILKIVKSLRQQYRTQHAEPDLDNQPDDL